MAKQKQPNPDKQIAENYALYRANLDSDKTIAGMLDVSSVKKNQRNFYSGDCAVTAEMPFGNTSLGCKIKSSDEYHYTITYSTDAIESRLLARLDAGIGTHYNRAPGIPQNQSSVPMPHYHEYREDGYDVAYRIPGIDYSDESSAKFGYVQGFSYFSGKLHIKDASGGEAKMECKHFRAPSPDKEIDNDPNNNVNFPD